MQIHWIFHSGFLVEGEDAALVFDLFQDPAGVLPDFFRRRREPGRALRPVFVFVSHAHTDHCSPIVLEWAREPGVYLVLEDEAAEILLEDGKRRRGAAGVEAVRMRPGMAFRLGADGLPAEAGRPAAIEVATFGSTDRGVSFRVRLDGRTLFYAGDLNDWYWEDESTPEELAADEAAFDGVVEDLRTAQEAAGEGPLDVAFLPLDPRLGIHAARGPLRFARRVRTRWLVPMHLPAGTDQPAGLAREAGETAKVVQFAGPGASFSPDGPDNRTPGR